MNQPLERKYNNAYASCLQMLKQYDNAVLYLEKALNLIDDDSTILLHLGEAYYAKREYRRALSTFKRALEIDPENREIAERVKKMKAEMHEK